MENNLNEYVYHIWLTVSVGISSERIQNLLDDFVSPKSVYNLSYEQIDEIEYLSKDQKLCLNDKTLDRVYDIIAKCEMNDIKIMALEDEEYPENLFNIYNPPLVLYYKGEMLNLNDELLISMVGTRKATQYGENNALLFSYRMSKAGAIIVSGLAQGIDVKAVEGASRAKGKMICILANSIDVHYPKMHSKIQDFVAKKGLLISEYPPTTNANKLSFPIRNRILSGISQGVLVVESPIKGGSMITSSYAIEQGKDLFAIPYNICDENGRGNNLLIKNGGKLVSSIEDVLEEYLSLYSHKIDLTFDYSSISPVIKEKSGDENSKTNNVKEVKENVKNKTSNDFIEVSIDYSKKDDIIINKTNENLKSISEIEENLKKYEEENNLDNVEKLKCNILLVLSKGQKHIDEITNTLNVTSAKISASLLMLEISGDVISLPGKNYKINDKRWKIDG